MSSFEDLGLRPELLRALEDEELEHPTAVQEAIIPPLRRGGNLVARASTGSGKTLAYALGILDRLTPRESRTEDEAGVALRFLILVPTREEADRVALAIFPFAQASGLTVTVPGGGWGTASDEAEILVSPAAEMLEGVRASTAKLDQLEAIVIDGAGSIHDLGHWSGVDAIMDLIPREAQRVVLSATLASEVEDLIERRVKRALRYPAEPAISEGPAAKLEGRIGYVLVREQEKLEVLTRQLTQSRGADTAPPVIYARTDERAAELAELLSVRGFAVGSVDDTEVDVAVAAAETTRAELLDEAEEGLGQTISFDVPADVATLLARHQGDDDSVVMVEPRELPHLREIARSAHLNLRALPLPVDISSSASELERFRAGIRSALEQEDLTAQMLVLAPLFDDFGAVEVAAALAALLRRRAPVETASPERPIPASSTPTATGAVETGPAPKPFTRLYVGVGSRDDIRPGDLVGAVTGEAGIKGSQIGKIEIRDTFSVVEVQADIADQVIRAVNGTTIKGRSVRVDYDRASSRPKRPERRDDNRPDTKRKIVRRPSND